MKILDQPPERTENARGQGFLFFSLSIFLRFHFEWRKIGIGNVMEHIFIERETPSRRVIPASVLNQKRILFQLKKHKIDSKF